MAPRTALFIELTHRHRATLLRAARSLPPSRARRHFLGRCSRAALERNPELATYSWDIRAAEARIIQTRLRPNPKLSLQSENPIDSGDFANGDQAERTLQLSQLVELGGKRPARVGETEAGRTVAEFDYQVRRGEVLRRLSMCSWRSAWCSLPKKPRRSRTR